MKAVACAAAVVLAVVAGTARAATFAVLPQPSGAPIPALVPSAEVPNAPGSLVLRSGWTEAASATRQLPAEELGALWRRAGGAYGIPWQVLAAINKVETNFGRNMGPSSAGAVGWMQFMPDTWLRWGLDADADGLADPWNPYDAVYAAARYLAASGGSADLSRAIFAYNHADWYVREVLDLARLYGGVDPNAVAFELDRLQLALDEARAGVARANRKVAAAVRAERRLARREAKAVKRADAEPLLSDALILRKRAAQIGIRRAAAAARARQARAALGEARTMLQAARQLAAGASFASAARSLFGAPFRAGDYVFPVGGGPAVAAVARDHHDYPAADIAAPAGTPVYAHANALVRDAWPVPQGRCGIGFSIDTADGQSWTYCHLSYLEPRVEEGVLLAAGDQVGLVGSTGRSTGPHLHLQLNPADAYPQEQPWFLSFAGSAFRWQDEGVPGEDVRLVRTLAHVGARPVFAVLTPAPVFAVLPSPPADDGPVLFTQLGG